jgi:hypothetical protein
MTAAILFPTIDLDLRDRNLFDELQGLHGEMIRERSRIQADVLAQILESGQLDGKKILQRWRSESRSDIIHIEIFRAANRVKALPSYPK